jgi:hypothetical protein
VPLDPAYKAGVAGHLPARRLKRRMGGMKGKEILVKGVKKARKKILEKIE